MDVSGSEISLNWNSRVSGLWSKMGPKFGIESMRTRLDVKNNNRGLYEIFASGLRDGDRLKSL